MRIYWLGGIVLIVVVLSSCVPSLMLRQPDIALPGSYGGSFVDTMCTARVSWREWYHDSALVALIDSALSGNQELNIVRQEVVIAGTDIDARIGDYLPAVSLRAGAGIDKVGRYTRTGALEHSLEIEPGRPFPEPMTDLGLSADVSWEVDIWGKLHNATQAARLRFLASADGVHAVTTGLVAEVARSYFELLALRNILDAVDATIVLLADATSVAELQKQSARATELAVKRFRAELRRNESYRSAVQQRITEVENRISFLTGSFTRSIDADASQFLTLNPDSVSSGLPVQLLTMRPDVRQSALEVEAAGLDVDVAEASFYPALHLGGGLGVQAYRSGVLFTSPESLAFGLLGDLAMPLLNRASITAAYRSAGARQVQAVLRYEQVVRRAFIEVANSIARIRNLNTMMERKRAQVEELTASVGIATDMFKAARADYMEVLLAQRDALDARIELIETRSEQLQALVTLYQALGGGWQ